MAINRSTLFDRLDESEHTFTDVICKRSGWYGSSCMSRQTDPWTVYAVTDDNAVAAEVAMPRGPYIALGSVNSKAAAGAMAGKFKRWLKEYNDNV